MKSLGQQFEDKMLPRIENAEKWKKVNIGVAKQLTEGAQNRSRKGETVRGGNYDRNYAQSTKRSKGKKDPVTLRDKDYTIKRMRRSSTSGGSSQEANIRGADRLKKHDQGTAKGGKQRQLFPHASKQIPRGIFQYLKKEIKRILLGAR